MGETGKSNQIKTALTAMKHQPVHGVTWRSLPVESAWQRSWQQIAAQITAHARRVKRPSSTNTAVMDKKTQTEMIRFFIGVLLTSKTYDQKIPRCSRRIFVPIKIKIAPPVIVAAFLYLSPHRLPIHTPNALMTNVTQPMKHTAERI